MTNATSETGFVAKQAAKITSAKIDRRTLMKGTVGAAAFAAAVHAPAIVRGQSKTDVTFWTTFSSTGLDNLTDIVNAFNAQSTDTNVKIVQIPPAEVTDSSKLITAVRGGTGPDVYLLDRFIVNERAANGLLEDLTDLLKKNDMNPDLTEDYIAFAAREATFDGKPFALPFDTDVRALYYNKAMIKKAGIDPESWDPSKGVLLWDDIKETAAKLNEKDANGNFSQVGLVPWFDQGLPYTFGFSWGGTFFDKASCEVTPNSDKIVASGDWIYNYAKDQGVDAFQAFIQAAMKPGAPPQENPFIQQRMAMWITGDWSIQNLENYAPDIDYGITYLPVPTQGMDSSTWAGGWSVVIPKGAKEPEGAMRFMKYFAGPEGQKMYTKASNHIPTLKAVQKDMSLYSGKHVFFIEKLLPTTKNRPPLPVGAKFWDELQTAWQKIYLNKESAKDAYTEAKENTQTLLQPFCPVN